MQLRVLPLRWPGSVGISRQASTPGAPRVSSRKHGLPHIPGLHPPLVHNILWATTHTPAVPLSPPLPCVQRARMWLCPLCIMQADWG